MPAPTRRVMLVGSSGGHLAQLCALESWYSEHDATFVTFRTPDALSRLEGEQVAWAYHPTTRNVKNLVRNAGLAARLIWRERPDVIVSTGAGVALPFFVLGRLFGAVTVYVEVIDRLDTTTMTGRLCRPFSTVFCVQWPEQEKLYKGAVNIGRLM
ncbi:UDP-N-acetylglucosamine--LPS N-acetylglucosamine transferase [uncultured Serinicoccus sp.]|uniref:UDP-N-acetylglucosamine--LPS N-acetylglucosamine transferase n=1 Tax=uncultured Serinicoccus sp. TaxID=735514 RepID=UPI002608E83F|nr:UDP-N-acetylglucosamine--LPS N-acetylglucosamine transferase [uncultured Serinicoccus sp.]